MNTVCYGMKCMHHVTYSSIERYNYYNVRVVRLSNIVQHNWIVVTNLSWHKRSIQETILKIVTKYIFFTKISLKSVKVCVIEGGKKITALKAFEKRHTIQMGHWKCSKLYILPSVWCSTNEIYHTKVSCYLSREIKDVLRKSP